MLYLGLEVRTLYHGAILTRGVTSDAEQYTYSASGSFSASCFYLRDSYCARSRRAGFRRGDCVHHRQGCFVIDMAADRQYSSALSFIGLGVVLVASAGFTAVLLFPAKKQGY